MRYSITIHSGHSALSVSLDDLAVTLASLSVEQIDYVKAEALRIRGVQRETQNRAFDGPMGIFEDFEGDFPHVLTEDFDAEGR